MKPTIDLATATRGLDEAQEEEEAFLAPTHRQRSEKEKKKTSVLFVHVEVPLEDLKQENKVTTPEKLKSILSQ